MKDPIADDFFVPGMPDPPEDAEGLFWWRYGMLEDPYPESKPKKEDGRPEIDDSEIPY